MLGPNSSSARQNTSGGKMTKANFNFDCQLGRGLEQPRRKTSEYVCKGASMLAKVERPTLNVTSQSHELGFWMEKEEKVS